MNLEQWQRSEKIKAEAEAAAKRTVERVLNAVKEPAMSEFKDKLISGWVEVDSKTKSYLMGYRGLKTQHEHVFKDAVEHGHGFAMVSIEGVEQVSIAHVINPFPCEELGDDFPIENRISPLCKTIGEQS